MSSFGSAAASVSPIVQVKPAHPGTLLLWRAPPNSLSSLTGGKCKI